MDKREAMQNHWDSVSQKAGAEYGRDFMEEDFEAGYKAALAIGVKALQARIEYLERELDAARSRQSQQAQGQPIGFIDPEGMAELQRGHPARVYAPNDTPWGRPYFLYLHPPAPVAVPEGWKLVPEYPTWGMLEAMSGKKGQASEKDYFKYTAMIQAAPELTDKDEQQAALFRAHNGGEG